MTTTLTLYKDLILETVKNETHISAHVQRAANKDAAEVAFHEEAGDESYHLRKLDRSFFASLDRIKAEVASFLDTTDSASSISSSVTDTTVTISIKLSDRFNKSYLTPLADLFSKYIEDNMLFLWWTPINASNAKIYSEHVAIDKDAIMKCFTKNAPAASSKSYSDVTGS